jgi:hypothetical protein
MKKIKKSLFLLGDSISIHYRPFLLKSLNPQWEVNGKDGLIEAMEDLDFPRGANGGDSDMILDYLRETLPFPGTELILCNCGLHDIKRYPDKQGCQVSSSLYERNLEEILSLCRKTDTKFVWITITEFDETIHNQRQTSFKRLKKDLYLYNKIALEVMERNNVDIIDLSGYTRSLGLLEKYIDSVHFSLEIRKLQGEFLAEQFQKLVD